MSSLWDRLGFAQNPYFTFPIEISDEGRNLFVGRGSEIRRLLNKWDEVDGAITVIGGNIGTGKTSFLNVCQYLALTGKRDFQLSHDPPRLVPAFAKIQLEQGQSDEAFLMKALRATLISIRKAADILSVSLPDSTDDLDTWAKEFERCSGLIANGGMSISTNLEHYSLDTLIGKLEEAAKLARAIDGFRGVIIAIDNIEMIEPDRLIAIMNKYRDTAFSAKGVWWILIGQKGLYDIIDAEAPRVSQRIKGMETTLQGLSWGDFNLAIQVRIDAFKTRGDAVPPIDETLLKTLFDASSGEIRYVFKMADEIVTNAIAEYPDLNNIPPSMAMEMLKESVGRQVLRLSLTSQEKRVTKLLCSRGGARPKDYKDYGFQNTPNFLQGVLQPLQTKGLVSRSTQGNATLYSPRPISILASKFSLL